MLNLLFFVSFISSLYECSWLEALLYELDEWFLRIVLELSWFTDFTSFPIENKILGLYLAVLAELCIVALYCSESFIK